MVPRAAVTMSELDGQAESSVFGRLDCDAGDTCRIGRLGVRDEDRQPLVVDCRAVSLANWALCRWCSTRRTSPIEAAALLRRHGDTDDWAGIRHDASVTATGPMVTVRGTCALTPAELTAAAAAGDYRSILAARGDFVVVIGGPGRDTVMTSRSGVVGHFHATGPAGTAHGPDVVTVARAAGLPWRWDAAAVADYLRFGYPFGTSTVHAGVRRCIAGAAVAAGTGTVLYQHSDAGDGPGHTAGAALAAAVSVVSAADDGLALSMSGGLDSRLLLSALLAAGRRPTLLASGVPGSFDREVSAAIAARYRLPLTVVDVTASQVLEGAAATVRAAAGLLPATNWAGLEHLRSRSETVGGPVILGYNGEFARSFYAAGGGPGLLRQLTLPRHRTADLLQRRFPAPFTASETGLLGPALRAAFAPAASLDRLTAVLRDLPGRTALDVADELFLTGFGQQKTGANLAAAGTYVRWSVPLFDAGWVGAVRRLPRRWKVGDRLHRHLIATLEPALLDFPDEAYDTPRTSATPPWRLWTTGPRPARRPHYLDQSMFRGGPLHAAFPAHRDAVADLVAPELFDRLAAEQTTGSRRPHVAYAILAMGMLRNAADG